MTRHKWTPLEHRCLVVMWENGVPIDQIAKALDRTHEDVNNTLVHLRMQGVKISNKIRAMKKRQVIGDIDDYARGKITEYASSDS